MLKIGFITRPHIKRFKRTENWSSQRYIDTEWWCLALTYGVHLKPTTVTLIENSHVLINTLHNYCKGTDVLNATKKKPSFTRYPTTCWQSFLVVLG